MIVHVICEVGDAVASTKSLNELLDEKLGLLMELYGVKIIPWKIWVWRNYRDTVICYRINGEAQSHSQFTGPVGISLTNLWMVDTELADYIAFCAVMACKPKKRPGDLITYYALKYGYE